MSGESQVTPPSVGDVLLAGEACGWPAVAGELVAIAAGEDAWRAAMTPDLAARVWEVWHAPDAEDDDEGAQA